MPLSWSLEHVESNSELFVKGAKGRRQMDGVTHCMIWASLQLDLGEITAKNVDEWVFRSTLMRSINRSIIVRGKKKAVFARAEIVRHIGLTTNVKTQT
jgi:hypothetical protein